MLFELLTAFCIFANCFISSGLQNDATRQPSTDKQIEALIESARNSCKEPLGRIEFIEKAIRLSRDLGDEEMAFRAAVERVAVLCKNIQFETALEMAEVAASLERANSDKSISGRLYLYRALAQLNTGDIITAIESLRYAKALQEGRPKELSIINNYLGICLKKIGNKQEAMKAMERALEQSEEANYHEFDFQVRASLAYLLLSLGETDRAEAHLKLLMPDSADEKIADFTHANLGLGEVALLRGEYDTARSFAQKAIDVCDMDSKFYSERAYVGRLLIGRCYLAEERFSLARKHCKFAVDHLRDHSPHLDTARLNLGLSIIGEGKEDEGLALIKKVAQKAVLVRTRKSACKKLVQYFSLQKQFESALEFERLLRTVEGEQVEGRLRLVESQFRPQLMVNRLTMIANEEKNKAIAEKVKSQHARMQAETLKRKASKNRMIRNVAIWSSGIFLIGCLFFFRSQSRIRQVKTEVIESRKRAELERQLAHKRRIESMGQLTSNVAHDFNNILQVVSSSNQLLEDSVEKDLDGWQRQLFAAANEAVDLGARITSQLLSFAGKQQVDPQPTLAIKFFESNSLLFSSVGGDEIKIELEDLTPELVINVDRSQLSNSLLNLLVNARRAMDGKGLVKIRLSQSSKNQASGMPEEPQSIFLKIEVIDEGCGMSSEEINKACEPYYTTKTDETGSGLGLSSVKGFVNQLGGWLDIESEEGVGTSVSLFVPATIDNFLGSEKATVEATQLKIIEAARCLIVEDNPSVQSSMVAFLENMKFECLCCKNADEAKELLQQDSNFQIVISDIRMPGTLDGTDLARWITENFAHISTILISGNEAPIHLVNCVFLRKPFRFNDLQKAIGRSLKVSPISSEA